MGELFVLLMDEGRVTYSAKGVGQVKCSAKFFTKQSVRVFFYVILTGCDSSVKYLSCDLFKLYGEAGRRILVNIEL